MRRYKPTYGISLMYMWAMMFLCCGPLLILVDILAATEGHTTLGQVFRGVISVLCVCGVAFALFILLISFLIGLFSRKSVLLSDHSVSYEGKTIQLDKIRYITLYLPQISKTSGKPQILTIWADNTNYMDIKRPSIALIAALKKHCVFASFDVDDWKSHLKQCLWIQVGIIVLCIVAIIFGVE